MLLDMKYNKELSNTALSVLYSNHWDYRCQDTNQSTAITENYDPQSAARPLNTLWQSSNMKVCMAVGSKENEVCGSSVAYDCCTSYSSRLTDLVRKDISTASVRDPCLFIIGTGLLNVCWIEYLGLQNKSKAEVHTEQTCWRALKKKKEKNKKKNRKKKNRKKKKRKKKKQDGNVMPKHVGATIHN
jgi:hypothetical protein